MSYKRSFIRITIAFIFFAMNSLVNSQAVCSLDELIKELYEDISDNGKKNFKPMIIVFLL